MKRSKLKSRESGGNRAIKYLTDEHAMYKNPVRTRVLWASLGGGLCSERPPQTELSKIHTCIYKNIVYRIIKHT